MAETTNTPDIQPAVTAPATATEVIEPLTEMEASLIAAVERWREQRRAQLEAEWQSVLAESNQRITPVLRAHSVAKGVAWEVRPDENVKSGWVLVKPQSGEAAPEAKPSRAELRRATKEVTKLVPKSRRGGR